MIKMRETRYCNMKLLLIFLVIYGHLIEPQIICNSIISIQYMMIYLFHMPAFAFLSGLFIKDCRSCVLQLYKIVPLYSVLQIFIFVCSGGVVDLLSPCWILWYLMSLSCWLCFTWCWLKCLNGKGKIFVLITAVTIGCIVGYVGFIDRRFSISRTLVFFPYFWLGVIFNCKTKWERHRTAGLVALVFGLFIFIMSKRQLTVSFLYQAAPYGTVHNGAILRLACYIMGVSVIMFLLTWIPDKRYQFTKAGADTMPAYILHAMFAVLLRELHFPWYVYLIVTAAFLWLICRVTQIKGTIYGITSQDRRDKRCPLFMKYTKKMQENCMDSCSLSPETKR